MWWLLNAPLDFLVHFPRAWAHTFDASCLLCEAWHAFSALPRFLQLPLADFCCVVALRFQRMAIIYGVS